MHTDIVTTEVSGAETRTSPASPARSIVRVAIATLAVLLSLGSFATVASADDEVGVGDLVNCIPTEFEPCPTVDPDPGDPTPIPGPGDLTICKEHEILDGPTNSCIDPGDPGDPNPVTGPGDLTTCVDPDPFDGVNPCPSPETEDNCRQAPVNPAFDTADPTRAAVYRLYCAYFLRYPDQDGFDFWHETFTDGVMNLAEISDFFAISAEFEATYGDLSNDEFVTLIYTNVLERAPEPEGYAFWVGRLDSGAMTRGDVMLFFSQSDEFKQKTGTE